MTRPSFLAVRLSLVLLLAPMAIGPFGSLCSMAQSASTCSGNDFRYLLVRRAGSPEKNYYDLSRTAYFLEPQLFKNGELFRRYKPTPLAPGFDIVTEHSVRYGVYQALKIRVITSSDSEKAPSSTRDGVYALIYARNPDWKFCAKKYSVASAKDGGRNITYTDFADGREYTMELSSKWPRPWQIYEIEILSSNAFWEIWQASKGSPAGVR